MQAPERKNWDTPTDSLPLLSGMLFSLFQETKDMKKQKPDNKEITIDMPEVKDIPGQEHVRPPRMREMEDTTPSSAGEEGEGILDDLNKDDLDIDEAKPNVTDMEKKLLKEADRPVSAETKDIRGAAVDKTDGEEKLNEGGDLFDMGEDLDVPGSELDDEEEELGEEDEENNPYSGTDN